MWTYSNDPSVSAKDSVRFLVGDTDPNEPLMQDEEIHYLLNRYSSADKTAYYAALAIAAKLSKRADTSAGKVSVSYSQLAQMYRELALELRHNAGTAALPYAGGIRVSDKQTGTGIDLTQAAFRREMMKNESS